MKQKVAFVMLVIAFGASGQVFGIDTTPYVSPDEAIPTVILEHFEPAID